MRISAFVLVSALSLTCTAPASALTVEKMYNHVLYSDIKSGSSFEELFKTKKLTFVFQESGLYLIPNISGFTFKSSFRVSDYQVETKEATYVEKVRSGSFLSPDEKRTKFFKDIVLEYFSLEIKVGYTPQGEVKRTVFVEVILTDSFEVEGKYVEIDPDFLYQVLITEYGMPITVDGKIAYVISEHVEGQKETRGTLKRITIYIEADTINGISLADHAAPY